MAESYELVVFDGDETLVAGDVIKGLAAAADVESELAAIHERVWQGDREPMAALREDIVPLFAGLPVDVVRQVVDDQAFTPGARSVCRRISCETAVFTSITPHATRIAEAIQADHARANDLLVEDGQLTGEIRGQMVEEGKGPVLEALLADRGIDPAATIVVGDGPQDVPMFDLAGHAIGVAPKPAARSAVDEVVTERDFHLVAPLLADTGVLDAD